MLSFSLSTYCPSSHVIIEFVTDRHSNRDHLGRQLSWAHSFLFLVWHEARKLRTHLRHGMGLHLRLAIGLGKLRPSKRRTRCMQWSTWPVWVDRQTWRSQRSKLTLSGIVGRYRNWWAWLVIIWRQSGIHFGGGLNCGSNVFGRAWVEQRRLLCLCWFWRFVRLSLTCLLWLIEATLFDVLFREVEDQIIVPTAVAFGPIWVRRRLFHVPLLWWPWRLNRFEINTLTLVVIVAEGSHGRIGLVLRLQVVLLLLLLIILECGIEAQSFVLDEARLIDSLELS